MKFNMYDSDFQRVKNVVELRLDLFIDRGETDLSIAVLKRNLGIILSYVHGGDFTEDTVKEEISKNQNFISKYFSEYSEVNKIFLELKNKREKMNKKLSDKKITAIRKTYHYIYDIEEMKEEDLYKYYEEARKETSNFTFNLEIKFTH